VGARPPSAAPHAPKPARLTSKRPFPQALVDELPRAVAAHVYLVLLPSEDKAGNALVVNAIQRSSFIIAQNSLAEGWGLTVTEAKYKRLCVVAAGQALGLRSQIMDGVDGLLVPGDCTAASNVAATLAFALTHDAERRAMSFNAQAEAVKEGLFYRQANDWLNFALTAMPQLHRSASHHK